MKVEWLNRMPAFPLPYFCLCTSEAEYLQVMKHLKLNRPSRWVTNDNGATTHTLTSEGKDCCVVCIDVPKDKNKGQVYALLIHEAVHIWQEYCEAIGEKHPSSEFEAYTIQAIAQALMFSYDSETLDRKPKHASRT